MWKLLAGLALGATITYMMQKDDPETVEEAADAVRGIRDRTIRFLQDYGWSEQDSQAMAEQLIQEGTNQPQY